MGIDFIKKAEAGAVLYDEVCNMYTKIVNVYYKDNKKYYSYYDICARYINKNTFRKREHIAETFFDQNDTILKDENLITKINLLTMN
jgi:hypothetical protein